MPLNVGYLGGTYDGATIRIYYDTGATPVGPTQPLVNGPRGYCLDVSNTSGRNRRFTVSRPDGGTQTISIGQGDPVTSGPPTGRSRTASEMSSWGFATRGDCSVLDIGGD